jgi:hypothetical protein
MGKVMRAMVVATACKLLQDCKNGQGDESNGNGQWLSNDSNGSATTAFRLMPTLALAVAPPEAEMDAETLTLPSSTTTSASPCMQMCQM